MSKSQAQLDFEAHVKKYPTYEDGTPRMTWDRLTKLTKWSWERKLGINPKGF